MCRTDVWGIEPKLIYILLCYSQRGKGIIDPKIENLLTQWFPKF